MPNTETLAELAKFPCVSVGKLLIGEEDSESAIASAPIQDISLLERFRDLEKLDRKDREVAITLIDALIESRHTNRSVRDDDDRRRHELISRAILRRGQDSVVADHYGPMMRFSLEIDDTCDFYREDFFNFMSKVSRECNRTVDF